MDFLSKTYKGLDDRSAAIQLAASFSGSLRSWWEHLSEELQGTILNPPRGQEDATRRLVEAVYSQFIGSKTEEKLMLQEAFNRAELCDINKTSKFLTEMRTLILKIGEENNMAYKTALIHKFPPAVAKVIMEDLADLDLSTLTLGDIIQRIERSITDLCYYHKARKEIVEATKFTKGKAFCQDSFYTTNYGCTSKHKHCSCKTKKKHLHKRKKHARPVKHRKPYKRYFRRRVNQVNQQDVICFICGKKGHFAKNCPTRGKNKTFNQIEIKSDWSEVDSNQSLQSSDFSILEKYSTAPSDSHSDSKSLQMFGINNLVINMMKNQTSGFRGGFCGGFRGRTLPRQTNGRQPISSSSTSSTASNEESTQSSSSTLLHFQDKEKPEWKQKLNIPMAPTKSSRRPQINVYKASQNHTSNLKTLKEWREGTSKPRTPQQMQHQDIKHLPTSFQNSASS